MIGKTFSHFRITAKLGEGGMGEVYRGEDTELDREVAIKVLPAELANDPERLERFRREAKAVAALNHPNIVTIHAIEQIEGTRILVMELIEGTSLDAMLSAGAMPLARVFDIAVPMADALAAAHDRGIVHRDLKPANVMVTPEGRVKVLDFGLAKLAMESPETLQGGEPTQAATATATLTREGAVMGTAPYMSPEQLQGLMVDHRSDIFSLGIVLYEMITGKRPFAGATGIALASSILKDTPLPVIELRENLPRHLARIVGRCLEKDPERRYQSIKDVRNELEDLREEALSGVQPESGGMAAGGPPTAAGAVQPPGSEASPAAANPPSSAPPGTLGAAPAGSFETSASGRVAPAAPDSATSGTVPPRAPGSGSAAAMPGSGVGPATPASGEGLAVPSADAIVQTRPRNLGFLAAIAAVVLVLVAGVAWWMGRSTSGFEPGAAPAAAPKAAGETSSTGSGTAAPAASVAVLPFADLSPEQDQEYFTDGMTEEILQALGTIEDLKVPSRTAVFALKGKGLDLQQVGERLGVATVLEGSVRKSGNRLRISTQLVQVDDGFKLWSDTYDRELDDVFAIQDEIAGSIADALRVELSPAGRTEAALGGTEDTTAYDYYLRAEQYRLQSGVQTKAFALELYRKAIEKDPTYALAWIGMAKSSARRYFVQGDPADLTVADQASSKALALAPELSEAHLARAMYFEHSGDDEAAEREYLEAIRLDPDNYDAYNNYGSLTYRRGDLEKTAELWERSVELDPDGMAVVGLLPQVYRGLGRKDEELMATQRLVEWTRRRLELYPDDVNSRLRGALGLINLGQRDQADNWLRIVEEAGFNDSLTLYNLACVYSLAGEVDKGLDFLERSVEAGAHDLNWFLQDSDLDNLRGDPRFTAVIERLKAQAEG